MKTMIGRLLIAIVLFAGAAVSWSEAKVARRVADAYERLATLHYDRDDGIGQARSVLDRLPLPMETLGGDIQQHRTTVSYWRGEYGALSAPVAVGDLSAGDPAVMMTRANASYRTTLDRLDDTAILERLDGIVEAYGEALRADPTSFDASYNYEYIVMFRDKLAKLRPRDRPIKGTPKRDPEIESVDLPTGPTLYGRPGGPPPEIPGSEFKTIAPMPYDEREQTEPGKGATPRRRG
jgi:hypothetical protein